MATDPNTVFRVLRHYGVSPRAARDIAKNNDWRRVARAVCYATTNAKQNIAGFIVSAIRWEWETPFLTQFELEGRWETICKEHDKREA